jgi:hypothetical protein
MRFMMLDAAIWKQTLLQVVGGGLVFCFLLLVGISGG